MGALGPLLSTLLPHVIQLYKVYREHNPNDVMLTDDAIIDLLRGDSQTVVDRAKAWLDAHPKPTSPTT